MTQFLQLKQNWLRSSTINVALSLFLLMPIVAKANENRNSSDDPPPQTTGTSGGSRGCETLSKTSSNNTPALILLAPTQRFGQTVTTRPTFAWFVRDSNSWQMEFRLYEYDTASKKSRLVKEIKDENFKSSPGIMVMALSNPELSVGKSYLWQVELVCDANRPSGNPFAMGAMKVVPVPLSLKTKLSQTHDTLSKATLYAQADLWYDSLKVVLAAPNEPKLEEVKSTLLKQVATIPETAMQEREKLKLVSSAVHQLQR